MEKLKTKLNIDDGEIGQLKTKLYRDEREMG
jgi:hypothetical protein